MKVIGVEYKGKEYTINEDEVFLVCDAIEAEMTLGEMAHMMQDTSKIRFAQLAAAYAALLREVGVSVTQKQVHKEFRDSLSGDAKDGVKNALLAISSLMQILMDGSPSSEGDKEQKNEEGS